MLIHAIRAIRARATKGDLLLALQLVIMDVMFIPTALDSKAHVSPITAFTQMSMILLIGCTGYAMNRQWVPFVPALIAGLMWATMLSHNASSL